MESSEIPQSDEIDTQERAVSPVIGVILMVAITVILAAVIAAFVLDLGDTSANPQATFDIEEHSNGSEHGYNVTVTNIDRLGSWGATCGSHSADQVLNNNKSQSKSDGAVGQTVHISNGCDNSSENVRIFGEYEGQQSQLR